MQTNFFDQNIFDDDFERVAMARQRAEVLSSVFLYDEDEEARAKVDADDYASVYSVPRMRGDESLHVLGRDLALTVDTDLADMPMDLAQRAIERVEDEERRNGYRERLQQLGAAGGDTAQDYYRLYAQVERDNVQGTYRAQKQKLAAMQESVRKMELYVRGDDMTDGGEAAFSEQDLANVRSVVDKKTLDDATAVRNWMQTYVKPLSEKSDAEEMMRTLDGLEDEFFEVIGQDAQRAEMAYMAMMHWAEGVKQSNKVGVADELIVAVGKKLSNWADPRTGAIFATQGAIGPAGAINIGALQSASSQIQSAYKDGEERRAARSILRAAINKGMELGNDVNWWEGAARTAAQMTGDTLPYLVPGVGAGIGTLDVFSTGVTETADQLQLAGLSGAQAGGQALIETGVQAAVELLPFGKVGGWGLSKITRRFFGEAMEQGRAGKFARWVVRNTQKSTARALLAEGAASFVDEAVLEPVAGGIMTYGAEHTFDMLGVPHGRSREFYECFDELKTLFTDPHQAAGLLLFTAGLTGAGAYGVHQNVKYFARHRKMWEAAGLTPEQVDKVMAADDSVAVGSKMVDEGWQTDPAGMRKRVLEVCGEMAERGEVLVLTGEGALNPELENSELAEAYRAVWQEYQERGLLPKVEAVGNNQFRITKEGVDITLDAKGADAYLQHAIDKVDIAETRELQKRAGKGHYVDLRSELATAVSKIAGGAAMRAVEATSERSGIAVEDLTRGLPEFLAEPIRQKGMVTLTDAQNITEWALGVIDGLVQEGMSPADARMTRPTAQGMARSLGDWATFARDFAHRERLAGYKRGEGAITIGRTRNSTETQFDGKRVLGQTLMTIPGQVRHFGAVEDVTESFFDMLIQERAAVLLGDEVESATAQQRADAEAEALKELGDIVKRARAAVMKADPSAAIEEVTDGDKMSIIEALSTMATSKFLTSGVVPKWMQSLTQALVGNLEAAEALSKVRTAYAGVMEKEPAALSELENLLNRLGVHVQDVFREARIEAVDIQAWKSAQAITGARAAGAMGSGGAAVSAVKAEAEEHEDEIVRNERMAEPEPEVAPNPTRDAKEAREVLQQMAPAGNAPADMKGVFVDDQCYYNQAGGFWCGMIRKSDLRDGTEQVKIGQKGKHGVIAGKELTGRFQHSVGAIYVWRRKNGELQVISGRHRFAKLMEDAEAEYCNAYVFNEDAEHDERWARMLDYENNMRDDQADELTAATYVRETGLTDAELKDRGLMRNGTRCKRGALIGRFARQELWTRFKNGVIEPKDAEIICNLTRNISRQERIEEIQTRCCMLLEAKKSWEFIGGMVQLMANKEMVTMKQGLLDFGADFEADLARAAEWIERNIKAINESITLLKQGKKLSGKKRAEAERLGITTATQEGAEEMLRDLEMLKGQFELIGSYPDLIAQAQMWDGKTEVDPVGRYLEQAHAEREQAAAEGEMDADEYLAEQARKEAAEAVPSLFGTTMSMYKARTGADKFAPDARGKEPVLSVNVHAVLADGSKAKKNDLIADENGSVFWGRLPELDALKDKGYAGLNLLLRLGYKNEGFNHIVNLHGQWIMDAMGIDDPIIACKRFISTVLNSVKKINYITNGARDSVIVKSGETERYFIVAVGKDRVDSKYAAIKTAFVASSAGRYDSDITIYGGKDALELRIPMSSFGENQRFRATSERQDRSSDYPDTAAASPSEDIMPQVGEVVKHEELISYKNGEFSANIERNLAAVTPEMDARYIEAVKRDDMDAAQRMVNDVARMRGYMPDSDYQGSECFNGAAPCANAYFDTDEERHEAWENGDFEGTVSLADFVRRGMDPGELEWLITAPGAYQRADEYKRESIDAIRKAKASKRGKVTIYRAVRADIKEGSVRNGDWITFSKAYAEYHISLQDWEKGRIIKQVVSIDDVWWDGNDVNEWGYDDGKEYAYRNTANNRKLLDSVTYDKNGDVVPLSKRFDYSSGDVSFNVVGPSAKNWDEIKHSAFKGRDDGMLRAEIDASRATLKSEALRGKNLKAYRQIIADWNELPEAERKEVEAYAELCAERDEAANKLNETTENDFQEAYAVANKLADEANSKRVKVREIIGEFFKMKGADGSVGITAKNEIIDAMAVDFWCEWGSDKVENSLASDPMAMGMALMDVLDYPELYEAYPQLESLLVYTEDLKGYYGLAANNGWSDYIMMNRSLLDNWEQFRSTLLHEVQHVIQRIEGFAKGGNKESVRRKVKELLEGTGARIDMLERDLRWFSAVNIARDLLKEARSLRRYPNAWKRSGRRFEFARMSDSAEEIREKILRDIAERYKEFRREDTSETLLLDMPDLLLPEVHFHSVDSIEAGLAALDKLKSRKLVFRGTAAKKNRRLKDLQKRHDAMQKVLSEFEYEPYELYVRLAGEIESRNVQARRDWSMAERLARPFNETLEYPGEALVTYNMERVQANWEAALKRFLIMPPVAGTPAYERDINVCPTPAVMQMVGARGFDLVISPHVLVKSLDENIVLGNGLTIREMYGAEDEDQGKHKILLSDLQKLTYALANPICIAVSDKPKSIEIIIELKEGDKNILVAVRCDTIRAGQRHQRVNRITSLYGKDEIEKLLSHQMLYWDNEKARRWTGGRGLQLPTAPYLERAYEGSVYTPFDLVKYKMQMGLSFSMERASMRALDVLRGRADERAGETLIKDWQRACEAWNQLAGDDEGRLGNGAKMLGEMQALIGATKGVLPQKYCRMGHLNGLMRWAGIYARMQQDGELPKAGVIKGPIYQKFVERMQKGDELNRVQGMSEAEAKEAIALLAGERLDVAMLKVANECRRRLELFLKDREKERIDWIVERAYPKRQRGQQWPRGKMAAEAYRRMERAYELMKMQPDDLAELIKETKRKLSDLDSSDEEFEAKEEALEDELFLAQTFGAWDNMSFEQARRASGAMAEMVLAGRNEWQEKLRGERRRADYDRRRIAGNFKTSRRDSVRKRAKDAAKEKANRLTIGQAIARGGMSYAQLMLALEPKLGKEFTGRQIRMIAKAHEEIQLFNQERSRWMYKTLSAITGLKKEGDIEEWINANNEIFDTGIVLTPKMVRKCRLTPEEAREWLAMTAEERAERRAKMLAEAEARKEEPDNIPEESQMDELRRKLAASEENGTMPREYELRLETKVEQPLHCTKEALLFAILTFEQDDYKRLMEVNGVTEAQLKRMRELVGPKLLAWGYAMRDKLSEHGERMAELYEAYTGVPFAKRANYFRGVFDNALAKDNGEAIDVQNAITGGKYGIIIPRQYHNQKINWSTSATQVGLSTLNQQQNYISTAHITREWRTLLSNQEFEKRMRAEIGDAAMNMIHGWTKLIDGSVMVDAKVQASFKRFFGRLLSAYAVGRLAGNVYTVMKQGSALLNGLVGGRMPERVLENNAVVQQMTYRHIGVGEYLGYLAKAMSGRTEIRWSEIEAAGYIAGRKQEQGHHLEQAAMLAPGQKVPSKLGRKGRAVYEGNMEVIGWADRKSNTVAALAVAEAVYQQAKAENKDGMVPEAELRRVAIQTAGLMIELAAQPQLRTQKNYWAASGALGALGDFFFMFKSEALAKMGVYIAQMFAGNHKAWLAGWLSFGVANSLVLALIDYIRGYWPDDDDEDKWQKRGLSFGTNVLFLDITSVPLLGDFAAWAQAEILGEKPWRSSIADMVMPFGDIWNAGKREVKNIRKAKGWDEHVAAMCSLARALGTSGGWVQNGRSVPMGTCAELALATAAISNIVRFGKDAVKFFMDED